MVKDSINCPFFFVKTYKMWQIVHHVYMVFSHIKCYNYSIIIWEGYDYEKNNDIYEKLVVY